MWPQVGEQLLGGSGVAKGSGAADPRGQGMLVGGSRPLGGGDWNGLATASLDRRFGGVQQLPLGAAEPWEGSSSQWGRSFRRQ